MKIIASSGILQWRSALRFLYALKGPDSPEYQEVLIAGLNHIARIRSIRDFENGYK